LFHVTATTVKKTCLLGFPKNLLYFLRKQGREPTCEPEISRRRGRFHRFRAFLQRSRLFPTISGSGCTYSSTQMVLNIVDSCDFARQIAILSTMTPS